MPAEPQEDNLHHTTPEMIQPMWVQSQSRIRPAFEYRMAMSTMAARGNRCSYPTETSRCSPPSKPSCNGSRCLSRKPGSRLRQRAGHACCGFRSVSSRVEPAMSVNRNVTVPPGSFTIPIGSRASPSSRLLRCPSPGPVFGNVTRARLRFYRQSSGTGGLGPRSDVHATRSQPRNAFRRSCLRE
jgi:hypothetical protein